MMRRGCRGCQRRRVTAILQHAQKMVMFSTTPKKREIGPLRNVRVLDLSRVLAGPFCTMLLGDMGADIIKIERPHMGDDTRRWGPPFTENGHEAAYFLSINRNKRSVAIDFSKPKGREMVRKIASQCDVLIENFLPGTLSRYQLGYEHFKDAHPSLIYASISGYGERGPMSGMPAYDAIVSALGGMTHITGSPEQPARTGVAVTDLMTGVFMQGAITAALVDAAATGVGQRLDISLLGAQLASLVNVGQSFLCAKSAEAGRAKRHGTAHPSIVPYQAWYGSDGVCFVAGALNDKQFRLLCDAIDLATCGTVSGASEGCNSNGSDFFREEQFSTNAGRVLGRAELTAALGKTFARFDTAAGWIARLESHNIPCSLVNDMPEVFNHPQVRALNLVETVDHSTAGPLQLVTNPVGFSSTPACVYRAPPTLGQHTCEVLHEFGLVDSNDEIADLELQGVVQSHREN